MKTRDKTKSHVLFALLVQVLTSDAIAQFFSLALAFLLTERPRSIAQFVLKSIVMVALFLVAIVAMAEQTKLGRTKKKRPSRKELNDIIATTRIHIQDLHARLIAMGQDAHARQRGSKGGTKRAMQTSKITIYQKLDLQSDLRAAKFRLASILSTLAGRNPPRPIESGPDAHKWTCKSIRRSMEKIVAPVLCTLRGGGSGNDPAAKDSFNLPECIENRINSVMDRDNFAGVIYKPSDDPHKRDKLQELLNIIERTQAAENKHDLAKTTGAGAMCGAWALAAALTWANHTCDQAAKQHQFYVYSVLKAFINHPKWDAANNKMPRRTSHDGNDKSNLGAYQLLLLLQLWESFTAQIGHHELHLITRHDQPTLTTENITVEQHHFFPASIDGDKSRPLIIACHQQGAGHGHYEPYVRINNPSDKSVKGSATPWLPDDPRSSVLQGMIPGPHICLCYSPGSHERYKIWRHILTKAECNVVFGDTINLEVSPVERFPAPANADGNNNLGQADGKSEMSKSPVPVDEESLYPQAQFGKMLSPYERIKRGSPHTPVPATMRFLDTTVAEATLAYGMHTDYQEMKQDLARISLCEHWAVVQFFENNAFVRIRLQDPNNTSSDGDDYKIPPSSTVKLMLRLPQGKHCEAIGTTIDNTLGLPSCDMLVLITGGHARRLGKAAERITGRKPHAIVECPCKIDATPSPIVVARQIDAAHKAYCPNAENSPFGALLKALLYDGDSTHPDGVKVNPWTLMEGVFEMWKSSFPWDEDQLKFICGSREAYFGHQICQGPAGAGKTKLMEELANAVASHGHYFIMTTDRNAAADTFALKLHASHGDKLSIVRAYARAGAHRDYIPGQHVYDREVSEKLDTEDYAILRLIRASEQRLKRSGHGAQALSIEAQVVNLTFDVGMEGQLMKIFNDTEGNPVGCEIDVFLVLRDFLNDMRRAEPVKREENQEQVVSTVETVEVGWSDKDRWRFHQASNFAREYVLENANVLITTAVNCGDDEIRRTFARKHGAAKVVLAVDEATTVHEASLLIPLAMCWTTFGRRIAYVPQFGDLKQLGTTVWGRPSNAPECYNEFADQIRISLMERMSGSGYPVYKLTKQSRIHPRIFSVLNELFYDKEMGTRRNYSPAGEVVCQMVRKVFKFPEDERVYESNCRLIFAEIECGNTIKCRGGSRMNAHNYTWLKKQILGPLHDFYGNEMSEKVLIVTPYRRQAALYKTLQNELRAMEWPETAIPRVKTGDSSVGDEASHVIVDAVNTEGSASGMGFLMSRKRVCVLLTRAKEILWVIGGTFNEGEVDEKRWVSRWKRVVPPLVELKRLLAHQGQIYDIAEFIAEDVSGNNRGEQ